MKIKATISNVSKRYNNFTNSEYILIHCEFTIHEEGSKPHKGNVCVSYDYKKGSVKNLAFDKIITDLKDKISQRIREMIQSNNEAKEFEEFKNSIKGYKFEFDQDIS